MQVTTLFTGVAHTHIVANERGVYIVDAGMPRKPGASSTRFASWDTRQTTSD